MQLKRNGKFTGGRTPPLQKTGGRTLTTKDGRSKPLPYKKMKGDTYEKATRLLKGV